MWPSLPHFKLQLITLLIQTPAATGKNSSHLFCLFAVYLSNHTKQVPHESLSSLLGRNVKTVSYLDFDVFSTDSPIVSRLHPRTSPTMTYQYRLKASVRAILIVGNILATLTWLTVSTDSVADPSKEVMAVLRSKHHAAHVDTRILPFLELFSVMCDVQDSSGSHQILCRKQQRRSRHTSSWHIWDIVSMDASEPGHRLLRSISLLTDHILNGNLSY